MNRKILYIIAVIVVLVHLGLYYALSHVHSTMPKVRPVQQPNFGVAEEVYHSTTPGESVVYREIRVSTKFADPALLEKFDKEKNNPEPAKAGPSAPAVSPSQKLDPQR